MSLIGDEKVISLQRTKVSVFSDCVFCLGEIHENLAQTQHGKKDWRNSKAHWNTESWIELMVSQLVLCLGEILENPQSNPAWEERLA